MKKILLLNVGLICFAISIQAQQNPTSQKPARWVKTINTQEEAKAAPATKASSVTTETTSKTVFLNKTTKQKVVAKTDAKVVTKEQKVDSRDVKKAPAQKADVDPRFAPSL
jgi:hypothetical protein